MTVCLCWATTSTATKASSSLGSGPQPPLRHIDPLCPFPLYMVDGRCAIQPGKRNWLQSSPTAIAFLCLVGADALVLHLNIFLYILMHWNTHTYWNILTVYSGFYSTPVTIFCWFCSSDKGQNLQNPAQHLPPLSNRAQRINHPHSITAPWERVTSTFNLQGLM